MLHNARSGKLRRDVKCGDEECGMCNALCDCCAMSDVENDAMCCDVRCGVKSRCGGSNVTWNMVWCEMCCDVECGCGVV